MSAASAARASADSGSGRNADLAAFLEHFRPDGYTTFVGIVPDGSTVAETFNGADPGKAAKWIESQNRAHNVYFTVNPTAAGQRKKPLKSDITAIAAVWADIDPRDDQGAAWAEERKRPRGSGRRAARPGDAAIIHRRQRQRHSAGAAA
jgi:hypothetical protein